MNYWPLLLAILPVWTVVGNIVVIICVYREKSLHNFTNYLVLNLSIADILVAIFAMPFHIYVSVNEMWSLGNGFCDISLSIDSCTAIVSKFTLVAISVDRYIAVMKPLTYRSLQIRYGAVNRFALIAFFIWVFSLAVVLPFLFGINKLPERISTICTFYNSRYSLVASIFTFWIPSLVLIVMYIRIIHAIRMRTRRLSRLSQEHTSSNPTSCPQRSGSQEISNISSDISGSGEIGPKKGDRRTTITIAIILCVFFICWSPFYGSLFAQYIYERTTDTHDIGHWYHIYLYTGWLGYGNSCLNFVIYAICNPMIKQILKKQLMKICIN